jgi:hypothetical protein
LADDTTDVFATWEEPAVILLAHNKQVTYGYTGLKQTEVTYFDFLPGSVVVDPWRKFDKLIPDLTVIHYGDTR